MNDESYKVITPAFKVGYQTTFHLQEIKEITFLHECVKFFARESPIGDGYEDTEPYIYCLINEDRSIRRFSEIGTDGERAIMENFNTWIKQHRPGFVLSRAVFYPRRSLDDTNCKVVDYKPVDSGVLPTIPAPDDAYSTTQIRHELSEEATNDLQTQLQIAVIMATRGTVVQREEARLFLRNYFFGNEERSS